MNIELILGILNIVLISTTPLVLCFSEFFIYVTYDLEGSYGADLRAREFGLVNCSRRLVSLK